MIIQVHADGTKIRRSVSKPVPEFSKGQQDSLKSRFVYAVSVNCVCVCVCVCTSSLNCHQTTVYFACILFICIDIFHLLKYVLLILPRKCTQQLYLLRLYYSSVNMCLI